MNQWKNTNQRVPSLMEAALAVDLLVDDYTSKANVLFNRMSPNAVEVQAMTNVKQRSSEWLALRLDRFTASSFAALLNFSQYSSQNTALASLLHKLPRPVTKHMQRGITGEAKALAMYANTLESQFTLTTYGFVVDSSAPWIGCSPDAIRWETRRDGIYGTLVEIKCPSVLIASMEAIPVEHIYQIQGSLTIVKDFIEGTGRLFSGECIYVQLVSDNLSVDTIAYDAVKGTDIVAKIDHLWQSIYVPLCLLRDEDFLANNSLHADPTVWLFTFTFTLT